MAVNEENAMRRRVVTAPPTGAAGVVPAVIRYWLDHVPGASVAKVGDFLLTASAIGGLCKHNASISGAECGCQAEIGQRRDGRRGLAAVLERAPPNRWKTPPKSPFEPPRHDLRPGEGPRQCPASNGMASARSRRSPPLPFPCAAMASTSSRWTSASRRCARPARTCTRNTKETSLGGLAVNVPNC